MFVVLFHSSLKIENYIACPHPILDPFDPIMMKFVKKEPPLVCNPEEDWVTIKGNIARITDKALKKYGDIQCKFMGKINIRRRQFLVNYKFRFITNFVFFFRRFKGQRVLHVAGHRDHDSHRIQSGNIGFLQSLL